MAKSERLNIRVTETQDEILRRAAAAKGETVTDYVVRHAVEAAEMDLADRRVFVLDPPAWAELQGILDRPPSHRPALEKLMATPTILEQQD